MLGGMLTLNECGYLYLWVFECVCVMPYKAVCSYVCSVHVFCDHSKECRGRRRSSPDSLAVLGRQDGDVHVASRAKLGKTTIAHEPPVKKIL